MDKGKVTELVIKAQSGDSRAMEDLLKLAHTSVSYQCRKFMPNAEDAEDMTQETLLKIYQNIGSLNEPEKFMGWANRIAARQCINALRRNPKDLQFAEDEDGNSVLDDLEELDEQRIPDAALDNTETTRMVQELMDGLPEAQRTSAYLFYYDEMSVKEISELMGVSENTVKSRLNYARKALKEIAEKLEKRDGVKLYGMSPLPFLLFFLRRSAEGGANFAAADAMAKAVIATESAAIAGAAAGAAGVGGSAASTAGAAAGAAGAGGTAAGAGGATAGVLGAVGTKVVAGIVAGAVAVGGIAATVTLSQPDEPEPTAYETQSPDVLEEPPVEEPSEELYYGLNEYLATGETIWYYITDYDTEYYDDTNSPVETVFVLEPDGSMYYSDGGGLTLGDYEQMEDGVIAAMVKERYEQSVTSAYLVFLSGDEAYDISRLGGVILNQDNFYGLDLYGLPADAEEARGLLGDALLNDLHDRRVWISSASFDSLVDLLMTLQGIYLNHLQDGSGGPANALERLFADGSPLYVSGGEDAFFASLTSELGVSEACAAEMRTACQRYRSIMATIRGEMAAFVADVPAGSYGVAVNADSTGSAESLLFVYGCARLDGYVFDELTLRYSWPAGPQISNTDNPVYDSYYGSYTTMGGPLYTRVSSNRINFVLEPMDAQKQ